MYILRKSYRSVKIGPIDTVPAMLLPWEIGINLDAKLMKDRLISAIRKMNKVTTNAIDKNICISTMAYEDQFKFSSKLFLYSTIFLFCSETDKLAKSAFTLVSIAFN